MRELSINLLARSKQDNPKASSLSREIIPPLLKKRSTKVTDKQQTILDNFNLEHSS